MAEATKQFKSLLLKYIPKELYIDLLKLNMYSVDNNAKGFELKRLLTRYGVPYTSLGSGTNRFGILMDGYSVKFSLDSDGMIDNQREFLYSKKLYPRVIKCHESFPNGLCAVTEYVDIFTLDDFYKYQDEMREILSEISKVYFIGDVGITSKNYINWGIRHGEKDEICILDFAYIYDVKYSTFKCSCGSDSLLQYDDDFVNLICPSCHRKYTFGEVKRKVTRKLQAEEIGDISKIGYNLHAPMEVLPINPEFTTTIKPKKEKELTPNEIAIKEHRKLMKDSERQRLMFEEKLTLTDDEWEKIISDSNN